MKRFAWLLALAFLTSACGVGPYRDGRATNKAQARAVQTQVAQANSLIATQQTQVAAMFTPALPPSPASAEGSTVTTPAPTRTPTPTNPASKAATEEGTPMMQTLTPTPTLTPLTPPQQYITPAGLRLTVHRVWWTDQLNGFYPGRGKRFLMLDLEVFNPTGVVVEYAPTLYLTAQSAQGYVFRPAPLTGERMIELAELAPGGRIRGWVAFALYPDEAPYSLYLDDAVLDHSPALYLGWAPGP